MMAVLTTMAAVASAISQGFFDDFSTYKEISKRPTRYLFENLVRLGIIAGLAGESGIGKSWFLMMLAISAALGRPLLSQFVPERAFRVVVLLGEDEVEEVARRLLMIQTHFNIDGGEVEAAIADGRLRFRCVRPFHVLKRREPTKEFQALQEATKDADFIIIDPLSKHSGIEQENSNAEISLLMDTLTRLCRRGQATVLVSHHVSQASYMNKSHHHKAAPRGGTAFVDELRMCWLLYKEGEDGGSGADQSVCLEVIKNNYAPIPDKPIVLVRAEGGVLGERSAEFRNRAVDAFIEYIRAHGPVEKREFERGAITVVKALEFIQQKTGSRPGKQDRERILKAVLDNGPATLETRIHSVSGNARTMIVVPTTTDPASDGKDTT